MELGYFALFSGCFLSATVLLFPSEALVLAMLANGYALWPVILIATLGNWLGSLTSYGLGRLLNYERLEYWFGVSHSKIHSYLPTINKYGIWMSLLTWIPFIGDPITIALGVFKIDFKKVAVLILVVKFLRYAILAWIFLQF